MKNLGSALLLVAALTGLAACTTTKNSGGGTYKPDDPALYATIVRLDSAFFAAYNTCGNAADLATYAAFFADSVEFYHDKGGLMTSKPDLIEATKRNVCGRVTRELVRGSLEVSPIQGYGAVEMGLHKFHNNTEPAGTPSRAGRFVIIWRYKNKSWKITRVISLH